MFTGLIQGLGHVQTLTPYQLAVQCSHQAPPEFLGTIALGDSIAVDGVCLTVEALRDGGFVASVSPETLARTTLGQVGDRWVNLEPSLRVGDKIGGHFVTGHVDGLGQLVSATESATSWTLIFAAPPSLWPYLVAKGSIAVNGISLTIAQLGSPSGSSSHSPSHSPSHSQAPLAIGQFSIAVIPHSYDQTNLQQLRPGDSVNLEGDILSKYVGALLGAQGQPGMTQNSPISANLWGDWAPQSPSNSAHPRSQSATTTEISNDFLSENGYQ
jgi:riboflavin synthase